MNILFWNNFVKLWYNRTKKPSMIIGSSDYEEAFEYFQNFFGKSLTLEELPEPYLMQDEKDVRFIIINLNPGGSADKVDYVNGYADTDGTKMYDAGGEGALLKKYAATCDYDSYQRDFSPLAGNKNIKPNFVCGYHWWHDDQNARMKWILKLASLYYKNPSTSSGEIADSEVLALELCPFHSKKWAADVILHMPNSLVYSFLKQRIYLPALELARENKIPFIACIGQTHCSLIEQHSGVNMKNRWLS